MTILPTPVASGSTTLSLQAPDTHPLKDQRRRLQNTQSQIVQIDRTKSQLQQLQSDAGRSDARRSSSSSEASSWSLSSTRASSGSDSVASDIRGRELLVPLSSIAYVPATISKSEDGDDHTPLKVFIRRDHGLSSETGGSLVLLEEIKSGSKKGDYEETTISGAIAALDEQRKVLESDLTKLRDEVVSAARATLMVHLGGQPESMDDSIAPVNEQGQALNEEGLPFVDPMEALAEGEERSGVSALAPHVRSEEMTKEERKQWMDSLLTQIESEEKEDEIDDSTTKTEVKSSAQHRPGIHRRMSSAERPAPQKSVLKPTGPLPLPIPKFGSSAFKRGFLNLNPSSPAAEHSSDPVEAIDWSQPRKGELSRGNSSMDESFSAIGNSSLDERMSRSMDLPPKKDSPQKAKKTVRILSPERESDSTQTISTIKRQKGRSVRDSDDDGQAEAASILELLGLDAIKDHPQAAGLYEALKDSEKMEQLAKKAEAARVAAVKREEEVVQKPAVSENVMERPNQGGAARPQQSQGSLSGFSKGFLNRQSKASTRALPAGPTISQGVSALDRASQSDAPLERERAEKGLKPAIPHARPSKAFAEKMEARRRGETSSKEEGEERPAQMSKVRFGDLGKAEKGTAEGEVPSEDGDEEDDSLNSIGMHISEEHLDDDTVEALGYFSDEEYDPDVGLDEEDILLSKPRFSADASQIANEELRREYERIKAMLGSSSHVNGGDPTDSGDDEDDFLEGRDLSMNNADEDTTRVSRFKQDRAKRALNGQSAVSNELGTGLDKAQNIGPSMLIPSIANIRYPIDGQAATEGQELQLQGQDDEEDDDLEDMMRQRLTQRELVTVNGNTRKPKETLAPRAPPQVVTASRSTQDEGEKKTTPLPAKKPSLFKCRMSQK